MSSSWMDKKKKKKKKVLKWVTKYTLVVVTYLGSPPKYSVHEQNTVLNLQSPIKSCTIVYLSQGPDLTPDKRQM